MKRVLCYGDSNTYGLAPLPAPSDWRRFDDRTRWAARLRRALEDCEVVEEGLPGRTTVLDDPIDGAHLNGLAYLAPCLASHWPIDVIVLMLGTNDLKKRFAIPPVDIAAGAGVLLNTIRRSVPEWTDPPRLLLIAPPPIRCIGWLAEVFVDGEAPSRRLAGLYAAQAALDGAEFLDAGTAIEVSAIDGIHFDEMAHEALAQRVAAAVGRLL